MTKTLAQRAVSFEDFCFLGLSRKPRERAVIGVLDDVLVGCIVVEQLGKPTVVGGEFLVDRIAIGNVQDLGHARLRRALTFAGFLAVGPAKCFQEIGIGLSVRQLNGPQTQRVLFAQARVGIAPVHRELGWDAGNLAYRVV